MIDLVTLSIAIGATLTFLVLQVVFLRFIHPFMRVRFLFQLAAVVSLLVSLCLTSMHFFSVIRIPTLLIILLFSQILYWVCIVLYMLTFFSNIESSITLKILSLISQSGTHGLSRNDLEKKYNRDRIVKRRIDRFVMMGELKHIHGVYIKKTTFSPFVFREYFASVFRWIFPLKRDEM